MILFVIWIPYIESVDTSRCSGVYCGYANTTHSKYCIEVDSAAQTVNLYSCSNPCDYSSLYLPGVSYYNVTCPAATPVQGFTGASCEVASDCYSYICSTPVCIGTPSNEYCPNDESCLPGYYCDRDAYTCQPSLSPGDPCSYDNECPVGYGCNLGTCILYFSLKKGSQASQNKVCKSNWVYKGQCDSVLIYKNGAVLQPPYNCKIGEMCSYVSYNTKATFDTQPCVCSGILNKGGGYCSNYLEWAEDLIQENFVYLSYTYSGCSGNYSHTDDPGVLLQCGSITQQQHDYMYNMQGQARYWNLYQSQAISSCSDALGLFNSSYTSLLYTYGLIHKMSLMFILMLYI